MNEEIEFLQGQLDAMRMVMTAHLTTLERLPAARACVALAVSLQEAQAEDLENETPHRTVSIRDTMVTAYLELLNAAGR